MSRINGEILRKRVSLNGLTNSGVGERKFGFPASYHATNLIRRDRLKKTKETLITDPPPIVFVTDFGVGDHAQAECQLVVDAICTENRNPSPKIGEAHNVKPFNVKHGSFIISQLASNARKGTIFVGVVDPGVGSQTEEVRKGIIIKTKKGHWLIGPDNGLFTKTIVEEGINSAYAIDESKFPGHSTTFHGRDIFIAAAARISSKVNITSFTKQYLPEQLKILEAKAGDVEHGDPYGNLKVNAEWEPEAVAVHIGIGEKEPIKVKVVNSFGDGAIGETLFLQGSSGGRPELVIRRGNAASTYRVSAGDTLALIWELHDGQRVPAKPRRSSILQA